MVLNRLYFAVKGFVEEMRQSLQFSFLRYFWRYIFRLKNPGIEKFNLFVWEFFTHLETDEGYKCWPIFGNHGYWAVRVLKPATPPGGHLRGPVTSTPVAERLELSLCVLTTNVCPDRRSNPQLLHARRTLYH